MGAFCSIASGVRIGEGNRPTSWMSSHTFQYRGCGFDFCEEYREFKSDLRLGIEVSKLPPSIGNDVWIGAGVMIVRGVKIGDGAILAGGSVVAKDVEAYSIVGGVPAKLIRRHFSDDICQRLQGLKWWQYDIRGMSGLNFSKIEQLLPELEELVASGVVEKRVPLKVIIDQGVVSSL